METATKLKKDWIVTPAAFEKLLAWLDADRDVAGEKYEKIRRKLIKLFCRHNCAPEDEFADIAINRVTRRIDEGAPIEVANPYSYFHGVALNIVHEFWRGQLRHKEEKFENFNPLKFAVENPQQIMERELELKEAAIRFACMRKCLLKLPPETRHFIIEYHHSESKKDVHKEIAEKLNISPNVLRLHAFRIRESLQKCADKCLKKEARPK